MHVRRFDHTSSLLKNGTVLIAGGLYEDDTTEQYIVADAKLYNPSTKTWTITDSMHDNREMHTASLLPNGKVLVAGGMGEWYNSYSNAELYDPTTRNWRNAGNLMTRRSVKERVPNAHS